MKKLTSFRLSESVKQNLKYLSNRHKLSQAELIEVMCNFIEKNEFDFDVEVKAYTIEKNPAFKKFKTEYDKLNHDEQKIMLDKIKENGFEFEDN